MKANHYSNQTRLSLIYLIKKLLANRKEKQVERP